MNRKRKIKQMRRFILKHGEISKEYKIPPYHKYYRKGSYFAVYKDEVVCCCVEGPDKYQVYKGIVEEIKYQTSDFGGDVYGSDGTLKRV